jgi:hypothetical protein
MRCKLALGLALIVLGCAAPPTGAAPVLPAPAKVPTTSVAVRRQIAAGIGNKDQRAVTIGVRDLSRMGATLSEQSQGRVLPFLDPSVPGQPEGALAEGYRHNFAYNGSARTTALGGAVVTTIPSNWHLIEGIAWDVRTGRMFAGSVVDRVLLVRDGEGEWRRVPIDGLGGLFGMAVDGPNRLLWLTSGLADPTPSPETAFAGLVAVDADRLTEVRRVPIPGARLGDLAIGEDGTVYASDGQSGAIYRCPPGCRTAETLVSAGILPSPQGMVAWPGSRKLYIADYEEGLLLLDLATHRLSRLVADRPTMLDGIDGLVRAGKRLIAIQNGTHPIRIAAISLRRKGRAIAEVRSLEQGTEGWGEPALGVFRRDQQGSESLLYVADGQWERYGPAGGAPRPTPLRALVLDEVVVTSRKAAVQHR